MRLAKRNLSADEFRAVAFALVELLPDLRFHLSRHSLIDYTAQQVATTAQRLREDSRIDLRPPPHQPSFSTPSLFAPRSRVMGAAFEGTDLIKVVNRLQESKSPVFQPRP